MFRLLNDIGELYTCTGHSLLLISESITANTRKLLKLCKYKVGQVPELVKVLSLGLEDSTYPRNWKTVHQGKGELWLWL
jgi:hypothetical protein